MKRGLTAFPYFGSKALVADVLWDAFGHDVPNFVDPFCGSCSVLLARPKPGKIETVNDAHAFIPNFLRAVKDAPQLVADAAAWPVSEIDMHARHVSLMERATEAWREQLRDDPRYFDAEMAGWWVWGASIWIGSGWCDPAHRRSDGGLQLRHPRLRGRDGEAHVGVGLFRDALHRKRPILGGRGARPSGTAGGGSGGGIFKQQLPHLMGPYNHRKLPHLQGRTVPEGGKGGVGYGRGIFASGRREDLLGYFAWLADRLAMVRITCGDWSRVVTPSVTTSHGLTAVLLDPPYGVKDRSAKLYAQDSLDVAADARAWALERGGDPYYRIALCGYEGEHDMPSDWHTYAWKANGGYGNQSGENANAKRERIWFSPWCLGGAHVDGPLFAGTHD